MRADGSLEGYLYVILGGQAYESLSSDIMGTYTRQNIVVAILAIVLTTAANLGSVARLQAAGATEVLFLPIDPAATHGSAHPQKSRTTHARSNR